MNLLRFPIDLLPYYSLVFFKKIKIEKIKENFLLFLKLLKEVSLPRNCSIKVLDFNQIKFIREHTEYFGQQEVKENKEEDFKLLNASLLNWNPHEVWRITISTFQKETQFGKIHHGLRNHCSNYRDILQTIHQLSFQTRQKGLSIKEITIEHTHPSLEVIIKENSKANSKFVFNGLSYTDQKLGRRLAQFCDHPLRIKAVTCAANYSQVF